MIKNIRREQMKEGDVYIGRAGHGQSGYFGNPFSAGTREENVARFHDYAKDRMYRDPEYRRRVKGLHDKNLFCFCAPLLCHGDVLRMLAMREHLHDLGVRIGQTYTSEEGLLTITHFKGCVIWFKGEDDSIYSLHIGEWEEFDHQLVTDF